MDNVDLSACWECVLFVANGDLPENDVDADRIEAGVIRWHSLGYHLAVGDEDYGFSWRHCDVCKSHLGGGRHEMFAMPINKPDKGSTDDHLERDSEDVVDEASGS